MYEACYPMLDEGVVVTVYPFPSGRTGKYVEIDHYGGLVRTRYMHLSMIFAHVGQRVDRKTEIAITGATGFDSRGRQVGPHVHVAMWFKLLTDALATGWPWPVIEQVFGKWFAVSPAWVIEHQEDNVSKEQVLDALREPLPELGNRSLLDVTRVSEDYVSSQVANIEASIARAKGDTVGEAKAMEWKAFYDAKINGQPIPPPA